jgi:hypothetical protein
MGVPTSEVGYTSATTGRGDHEVHKGHVVGKKFPERTVPVTAHEVFKIGSLTKRISSIFAQNI